MRYNSMSAIPFVNHTIVEVNQFRYLAVQMLTSGTIDRKPFNVAAPIGLTFMLRKSYATAATQPYAGSQILVGIGNPLKVSAVSG